MAQHTTAPAGYSYKLLHQHFSIWDEADRQTAGGEADRQTAGGEEANRQQMERQTGRQQMEMEQTDSRWRGSKQTADGEAANRQQMERKQTDSRWRRTPCELALWAKQNQ